MTVVTVGVTFNVENCLVTPNNVFKQMIWRFNNVSANSRRLSSSSGTIYWTALGFQGLKFKSFFRILKTVPYEIPLVLLISRTEMLELISQLSFTASMLTWVHAVSARLL